MVSCLEDILQVLILVYIERGLETVFLTRMVQESILYLFLLILFFSLFN